MNLKKFAFALLIAVVLVAATGFTAQPAQASSGCRYWHTVYYGQTLSSIGAYYGINWTTLASVNGIKSPYKLYAGTVLCIPYGGYGYGGYYYPASYNTGYSAPANPWTFSVVEVAKDNYVTIKTHSVPSNVFFNVSMGHKKANGSIDWQNLPDLDTGNGGAFKTSINIPAALHGKTNLVLRLTQAKKNGKVFKYTQSFSNSSYTSSGTGGYGDPYYYGGYYYHTIPTFSIIRVRRNNTVTIRTHNFPAGVTFDVLMGPMGTRGVGGYYVGTLHSGSGGTLEATYSIPPALYNSYQISIRTQNWPTGYYSFNWFYNNNAY